MMTKFREAHQSENGHESFFLIKLNYYSPELFNQISRNDYFLIFFLFCFPVASDVGLMEWEPVYEVSTEPGPGRERQQTVETVETVDWNTLNTGQLQCVTRTRGRNPQKVNILINTVILSSSHSVNRHNEEEQRYQWRPEECYSVPHVIDWKPQESSQIQN